MTENHTSTQSAVSPPTSTLQQLKEIAALFDTGSYTKEIRRVALAVRLTVGLRRKLTGFVISSFLDFALVPGSEAHTRLFYFVKTDEHDKEVDTASSLFAQCQESAQKDVERAFGVSQARFAIVKNPALSWDKTKIGKIMHACIILHNMIVEDERDGYSLYTVSEFYQGEGSGTSHVDLTYSTDMPTNLFNMMGVRNRLRDTTIHNQLKADLVEHI